MSEFDADPGATGRHSDIAPELRQLAETILDRLGPVVRLLVSKVQSGGSGKCEQAWCPVCAVIAVISGEQHPLLSVVAEHSTGVLTLAKAMLDNLDGAGTTASQRPGPAPADPPSNDQAAPPDPGRYQHITVILDE